MAQTIEILIPIAESDVKEIPLNPKAIDLNRKVVGFLWNEKPNGDVLLRRLIKHLSMRYPQVRTVWDQVGALHVLAEVAPQVKQMADESDVVIIATGD
jgi:hypothetical protein